ncbi:ras-related and estrogen-regulated growth inhibitor-like [Trichogramma pretiosum]|uniref:ras-related and estrogen-regulated growth inhibitor-like n=1 Tax=Trichogramma pretiosum TaxID=7493 RepID=UPI0006C9B873|nr:ras-related and estrogen-regulated growth inhibitor-like [Trichogramma pretiosum]
MQAYTGGWQFGFGSSSSGSKDSASKNRLVRIVLLGQPGVGKTAIAVRFASRRFIGEYDCSQERRYRVENRLSCSWELVDPPGNDPGNIQRALLGGGGDWPDAVLLCYSVADRVSFDETWRLRFLLNQAWRAKKSGHYYYHHCQQQPCVVLVGNKSDLAEAGERMVGTMEGRQRARDIEAHAFHEISARESLDQVMAVFISVARLVLSPGPSSIEHHHQQQQQHSFRLRASTDGSIERRRRTSSSSSSSHQQQQPSSSSSTKRRLSISARGAPH